MFGETLFCVNFIIKLIVGKERLFSYKNGIEENIQKLLSITVKLFTQTIFYTEMDPFNFAIIQTNYYQKVINRRENFIRRL